MPPYLVGRCAASTAVAGATSGAHRDAKAAVQPAQAVLGHDAACRVRHAVVHLHA